MSFLHFRTGRRAHVAIVTLLATLGLSACATLPSSGPTGNQIRKTVAAQASDIQLVEVLDAQALPAAQVAAPLQLANLPPPPTDLVGPGDILDIAIYESGVTLFGGGGSAARLSADTPAFDSSAKVERMGGTRVDDSGAIQLPYAGRLQVAGRSVSEVAAMIRTALRGFSQNPQIVVTIREMITNSVIVGGEVTRPGRLVLPTNRETVADAIALAGGYRGDAKDLAVRIQRRDVTDEIRLTDVLTGPAAELRVYPGDRLSIVRSPRTFSVMGAPGVVQLFPFGTPTVSLAEAIAQAGGSNPQFGDPAAIFVFRYVPDPQNVLRPVVYHVNMMKAGSYFLAQRFPMRDKDIVYVGNARANQPSKLVQIISQLFAPIVTATSAVQILRN
ncbi:capsule biosynthesis protein [Sphingomonas sp. Leaf33]|uniref:polysaccharide biosynthesis/export family protein n=1 Tax=Sphingomonas sp. Leaf33 TaxID=1736215 RepID=UPI0006FCB8C0|nr:polysaccharide biosynthesis/export family protein [Sphingomonas sp. Leaf33]KQN21239.1 capsule biosynthesis protein [Sphingomonas sp. Leaf33]